MNEIEQIIGSDYAAQIIARIQSVTPELNPPRWRYFNVGRSMRRAPARGYPMFAWSTERADDGSGRLMFASWRWQPVGDQWRVRAMRTHSKRQAAKSRALVLRDTYAAMHERA